VGTARAAELVDEVTADGHACGDKRLGRASAVAGFRR
jgi:hypothetical protein